MGVIRSQMVGMLKRVLASRGIVLLRPQLKFGYDPWIDIQRLAGTWNYSISSFFDVGANDGETAAAALRLFPTAQVTSFEPHPGTFSALMAKLGGSSRFHGVNSALGAEAGEATMFEYDTSKINSLTAEAPFAVRHGKRGHAIEVRCTTLDAYCAQNGIERIDILKVDTEGYDLKVLEGGAALLQRQAFRFVYVEFNDLQPPDGAFGGSLLSIDALLRPCGYRFIASYNDYIVTEEELFSVSNALFALPPPAVKSS